MTVSTGEEIRISTASAIDLAGSEDNRRTENGKERLVESASINKSLFVLAKCVEAIGQNQSRIPYRESKMTRILSLGQNNGLTVMILNLAPVRSYHLDTLSSLNFANRTKKIEVREIENEPIFKGCSRPVPTTSGPLAQRQALRPLTSSFHNTSAVTQMTSTNLTDKRSKAFSVYADRSCQGNGSARLQRTDPVKRSSPLKRALDSALTGDPLAKRRNSNRALRPQHLVSKETLEEIIERKVTDILASRTLDEPSTAPRRDISEDVQRRLQTLERKIEDQEDGREQGLTFLLMAKQHAVRGEDTSALTMYTMAKEFFPDNARLDQKIGRLKAKLKKRQAIEKGRQEIEKADDSVEMRIQNDPKDTARVQRPRDIPEDLNEAYCDTPDPLGDSGFDVARSCGGISQPKLSATKRTKAVCSVLDDHEAVNGEQTPRTKRLLHTINTRNASQIRLLRGVGVKKAEVILEALCAGDEDDDDHQVHSLAQLATLKGVGMKTVENMRLGCGQDFEALDPSQS